MPPATAPITSLILDNIEATLALIDGAANYYHAVSVVKIAESVPDQVQYPSVTIGQVGALGHVREEKNGRVLFSENMHWSVSIVGALDSPSDANRALLKLGADIHRAMMTDRSRGGLAINTEFEGMEASPPASAAVGTCWVEVFFDIHLRTKETWMGEQY